MPADLLGLLGPYALTLAISFLIGIGLREYYEGEQKFETFGTVRTFVFIGMLGFVLFQLPEVGRLAYLAGFVAITVFLAIYYADKIAHPAGPKKNAGMIGILIGLLTYAAGPITLREPAWLLVLIAISILFVLHSKGRIRQFTDRLETGEVVTACKFLAIAGVVLPLMPASPDTMRGWAGWLFARMPVTPRQLWLAVVVTTSISYAGYMMQTYLFPRRGLLITGIFGGVYSSTATVLVIARRTRESPALSRHGAIAVLAAIGMMYLRLTALVVIFRFSLTLRALAPLVTLAALASSDAIWLRGRAAMPTDDLSAGEAHGLRRNPLELSTALVFAALFGVVAFVTRAVLEAFHAPGLRAMSFAVGFSDITPFVVSVLQGNLGLSDDQVLQAVIITTASNNLLKAAYIWAVGSPALTRLVLPPLISAAVVSMAYANLAL